MLFETDITVLTTHTAELKQQTVIKLTRGIIHHFGVYFPPGCQHFVRCAINRGIHQVYPVTPGTYIKGDGINVAGDVFHQILTQPYEIDVWSWSNNAKYDHTITVRFWIKKVWQLMPFSDEMYELALKDELKITT